MTTPLRDRYKFLSHLPTGTNFVLAELQLDDGILSAETLKRYEGRLWYGLTLVLRDALAAEFARRAHERDKRAQQDTRRAARAERWHMHQMYSNTPTTAHDRQRSPPAFVQPRMISSARAELEVQHNDLQPLLFDFLTTGALGATDRAYTDYATECKSAS